MLDVEALYREHGRYVHSCVRRRLSPAVPDALVEDACASAWEIAWARRDRIAHENHVAWLVTVARHEALALLRKGRHETCVDTPHERATSAGDPELALEARESMALLTRLNPGQREVLALRLAGYSYKEIVRETGRTYTWTNRHASEGRAKLRQLAGQPAEGA